MRKLEHANLLLLIIALVAVGQMTQTIYVPVIADMAVYFGEPTGAVQQVMGAYLFSYGFSQLIYVSRDEYFLFSDDRGYFFTELNYLSDRQYLTRNGDWGRRGDDPYSAS